MDLNVVLPIKDPENSKQRLAGILTKTRRQALSLVLNKGVLATLNSLPHAPHILVVTDSGRIEELARNYGASVLKEEKACGETEAVERATRWSLQEGFRSQLVIPGDLMNLTPSNLGILLNEPRLNPSLLLCPATGDDGTNAILATPPDAVPYRFGAKSFEEFRERAKERDIPCRVFRLESFILDLDTPDDLRTLMRRSTNCPAKDLLRGWSIDP